jgi:hypothetical protein
MHDSLKNFVTALEINPVLIENAIQNHNAEKDLTSWKENDFFPSSSK